MRTRLFIALAALVLLGTGCAPALPRASAAPEPQRSTGPHLLSTPEGKVEILGLQRWTADEVEAAVRRYAPEQSLFSSACQVILRDSLGFPAASVVAWLTETQPGKQVEEVLITLVEPHDSARVQYRPAPADALPARAEWNEALAPFTSERGLLLGGFMNGLQSYGLVAAGEAEAAQKRMAGRRGAEEALRLWKFLEGRGSEGDRQLALWTLQHDGNQDNRMVALAVLSNFPEHDESWWAVLEALRDESERVRTAAQVTLSGLLQSGDREVDWAPAAPTLRHLLNGTNVSAFQEVLRVLTGTRIDPAVARSLLPESRALLLAHLQAEHWSPRRAARAFVAHVSGQDFGSDPKPWVQWVASLR
jgi:hypothetical protein